jgi:Ran GTPase-activating protein (RanGAP) involved in mRNA processing and transport
MWSKFDHLSTADEAAASAARQPLLDPAASWPTETAAPAPAAAMSLVPVQPGPRWEELLEAAKARPNDAAAWTAFARCFASCTEINLSGKRIDSSNVLRYFDDAAVTSLAQHAAQHWPSLQSLVLGYNKIGAAGAAALAQHAARHWPNLQRLDLGSNSIAAAGTTALAQDAARHWPNLQILNLSNNHIGYAGVTALAQHAARHWPNLLSLKLGYNSIGDAGRTTLALHAMQHWHNLQRLNLYYNSIGDAGATALAQHAMQHCPKLKELHMKPAFGAESISDAAKAALRAWAQRLPGLRL